MDVQHWQYVSTSHQVTDLCVVLVQDQEFGVEEEHHLGAGSHPKAWGKMSTNLLYFHSSVVVCHIIWM